MKFKMYENGGIYKLDGQRGKGKIYDIIRKSIPKHINKLFSKKSYAHVPSGTYCFYIKGYELVLYWTLNDIQHFFELLYRFITQRINLLMTIDYEGAYAYLVLMPNGKKDVRLVILDRKESNCRNIAKRYKDNELKNTVAVKDVIISEYELIKQLNQEFHRIYDENKYYLSKKYEEKCKQKGESICQEYILRDVFGYYMPIFDKYLENPDEFWKDSFFDNKKWNAPVYKTTDELKHYFSELEKENIFIGSILTKIMIMGIIFNDDNPYYTYKDGKMYHNVWNAPDGLIEVDEPPSFDRNRTENVNLTLDEPIALFVKDDNGIEQHFDIDFTKTNRFMIKPNSFNFREKSCITASITWQDVSKYFSKNIIGHKITAVEPMNNENTVSEFDEIHFVMDNGHRLVLDTDTMTGYMIMYEFAGKEKC